MIDAVSSSVPRNSISATSITITAPKPSW